MISGKLLKEVISHLEKTRNDLRYAAKVDRLSAIEKTTNDLMFMLLREESHHEKQKNKKR
jgi:hypothetical protein